MKEEKEVKHVNGKKRIFSLVSLAVLPFSVIFGMFWLFSVSLGVFRSVVSVLSVS